MYTPHWLTPKGELIKLDDEETHHDWLKKNTKYRDPTMDDAFADGWTRVFSTGKTIFSHNDVKMPSAKQKSELIDHALMNGFNEVIHAKGPKDHIIWSNRDQFSHKTYSDELSVKYG